MTQINFIKWHIILSTAALSAMLIAGILSVLLMSQDYYLREYKAPIFSFLPPLEKMEKYLFRTIIIGWILLSMIFISSFIFFKAILTLSLYAKMLLTLIAWGIFTLLLTGRYLLGWRGKIAVRWAFIGVILLLLIYSGTKVLVRA